MAKYRCPFLIDDTVGPDHAAVCRHSLANKSKFICPREKEQWIPHLTCFDLKALLRLSDAEMDALLFPNVVHAGIIDIPCGTGKPDAPVIIVLPTTQTLEDTL